MSGWGQGGWAKKGRVEAVVTYQFQLRRPCSKCGASAGQPCVGPQTSIALDKPHWSR